MAFKDWWKKDDPDLPANLKGKSHEDIVREMDEAQQLRTRVAQAEKDLADQKTLATTQQTELQATRQQLAGLNAGGRQEIKKVSVFDDEEAAIQQHMGPIAEATMQNSARLAQMVAEQQITSDSKAKFLLNKYRTEYEGFVAQLTPVQRGMEVAYHNCYKLVIGNHLNELMDAGNNFFSESSTVRQQESQKKDQTLNADQVAMAKKLGVSPEAYLKSLQQMEQIIPLGVS